MSRVGLVVDEVASFGESLLDLANLFDVTGVNALLNGVDGSGVYEYARVTFVMKIAMFRRVVVDTVVEM